jgi:hypothetical protein
VASGAFEILFLPHVPDKLKEEMKRRRIKIPSKINGK